STRRCSVASRSNRVKRQARDLAPPPRGKKPPERRDRCPGNRLLRATPPWWRHQASTRERRRNRLPSLQQPTPMRSPRAIAPHPELQTAQADRVGQASTAVRRRPKSSADSKRHGVKRSWTTTACAFSAICSKPC